MRTRDPIGNEDNNFFRCKRCGFPCNLSRDRTGPGSGLRYDSVTYSGSSDLGWDTGPDDPVVVQGCPYCGTKNFMNWEQ